MLRSENHPPTPPGRSSDTYFNQAQRAGVGLRPPCATHGPKLETNLELQAACTSQIEPGGEQWAQPILGRGN